MQIYHKKSDVFKKKLFVSIRRIFSQKETIINYKLSIFLEKHITVQSLNWHFSRLSDTYSNMCVKLYQNVGHQNIWFEKHKKNRKKYKRKRKEIKKNEIFIQFGWRLNLSMD